MLSEVRDPSLLDRPLTLQGGPEALTPFPDKHLATAFSSRVPLHPPPALHSILSLATKHVFVFLF